MGPEVVRAQPGGFGSLCAARVLCCAFLCSCEPQRTHFTLLGEYRGSCVRSKADRQGGQKGSLMWAGVGKVRVASFVLQWGQMMAVVG